MITAILTGDIMHSRKLKSQGVWLSALKKLLNSQGRSPKTWEISRGDSFQVEIAKPAESLLLAIRIKAAVKCIKHIDVRMSLGIGQKEYSAARISESNGEAFIYSGEQLALLKTEKQTLSVKSPWPGFNTHMHLCIRLAGVIMDNWSRGAAELVKISLEHPGLDQQGLAKLLHISQPSASERKKRANFDEIMELESYFHDQVTQLLHK